MSISSELDEFDIIERTLGQTNSDILRNNKAGSHDEMLGSLGGCSRSLGESTELMVISA